MVTSVQWHFVESLYQIWKLGELGSWLIIPNPDGILKLCTSTMLMYQVYTRCTHCTWLTHIWHDHKALILIKECGSHECRNVTGTRMHVQLDGDVNLKHNDFNFKYSVSCLEHTGHELCTNSIGWNKHAYVDHIDREILIKQNQTKPMSIIFQTKNNAAPHDRVSGGIVKFVIFSMLACALSSTACLSARWAAIISALATASLAAMLRQNPCTLQSAITTNTLISAHQSWNYSMNSTLGCRLIINLSWQLWTCIIWSSPDIGAMWINKDLWYHHLCECTSLRYGVYRALNNIYYIVYMPKTCIGTYSIVFTSEIGDSLCPWLIPPWSYTTCFCDIWLPITWHKVP